MLRVGFIGSGRISTLHALEYQRNPAARLVAVADLDLETARERGAEWGVATDRIVASYQDLLAMDDVDAVEILLPHHLHHRVAMEALAAGKHVSVQKPIAGSLADADEMIAAADAAGLVLKVYENIVFYPPYQHAMALIEAGEIGELISVRHKTFAGRSPKAWTVSAAARAWRADRAQAGGGQWLTDDGHHAYSLAWQLMGMPDELFVWVGRTQGHGGINDIPALVTYRQGTGRVGSWEATWSPELEIDTDFYAADDIVEITGTRGVIWVTRCMGTMLHQPPVILFRDGRMRPFEDIPAGWEESFLGSTRAFIEALTTGGTARLTGPQGRDILRLCLAAEASAATGRPVAP